MPSEVDKIGSKPLIDSKTLEAAYPKALLYAHRKLAKFNNSGLTVRASPQDVTHEAVLKVLSGERPWSPKNTPDLFVHLAGCINSIISNYYTSSDFKLVDRESEDTIMSHNSKQPEADSETEFTSKVEFILNYLGVGDKREDLVGVASLMLENGITEPKDLAEALNITVPEVNAIKIAIKRIMQRSAFLLHYISTNRKDLIEITTAMYKQKITDIALLAETLSISEEEVKAAIRELMSVTQAIHRGEI